MHWSLSIRLVDCMLRTVRWRTLTAQRAQTTSVHYAVHVAVFSQKDLSKTCMVDRSLVRVPPLPCPLNYENVAVRGDAGGGTSTCTRRPWPTPTPLGFPEKSLACRRMRFASSGSGNSDSASGGRGSDEVTASAGELLAGRNPESPIWLYLNMSIVIRNMM